MKLRAIARACIPVPFVASATFASYDLLAQATGSTQIQILDGLTLVPLGVIVGVVVTLCVGIWKVKGAVDHQRYAFDRLVSAVEAINKYGCSYASKCEDARSETANIARGVASIEELHHQETMDGLREQSEQRDDDRQHPHEPGPKPRE